jgi:hypothetical protein
MRQSVEPIELAAGALNESQAFRKGHGGGVFREAEYGGRRHNFPVVADIARVFWLRRTLPKTPFSGNRIIRDLKHGGAVKDGYKESRYEAFEMAA